MKEDHAWNSSMCHGTGTLEWAIRGSRSMAIPSAKVNCTILAASAAAFCSSLMRRLRV